MVCPHNDKHNKGVALFISIALLFLLSIEVIIVLLTSYNYVNITENQIMRLRAISVAESGVHYAYWKIRIGQDDDGESITYPAVLNPPIAIPTGWTVQVNVTEDIATQKKTISSTVTY